jgi:gamma-glutamyltranspeptidase / glutathione hydrolase
MSPVDGETGGRGMSIRGPAMIATSEVHAVEAGAAVLRDGGTAVDAALAAAACLTVTEPTSNGLGGDLFALVWDGERVHALDAAGPCPRNLNLEHVRDLGLERMPLHGWLPVTVPGQVGGWQALHERFCTLPLARLLEPAIDHARHGFPVGPITAEAWRRSAAVLGTFPEWRATFLPAGQRPRPGSWFFNLDLAESLSAIAEEGPAVFYRGHLADRIAEHAARTDGYLTREDLSAYAPSWVEPISVGFGPWQVVEAPAPTQGVVALEALAILEGMQETGDRLTRVHRAIEAIKLAFGDAYAEVGDVEAMGQPVSACLEPEWLAKRRATIRDDAVGPSPGPGNPLGGTVLVCAGDDQGRLCSLIQSNFHGFGSGIVVPGTGIALHDRGAGFVLDPGHPNALAPGKRPFHTILPGLLLTADGHGAGAFGCMGGQMQPQGHVQLLMALAEGACPQEVLDQSRWRWMDTGEVILERGFDGSVAEGLSGLGHRVRGGRGATEFGGGQIVLAHPDGGWVGGSDRRKDGKVAAVD